jgi:hypothetical protein
MIFAREKIEAIDNTFDDELQVFKIPYKQTTVFLKLKRSCKFDIGKYCGNQKGEKVLDCLMNTKIVRLLQKGCQKIVQERMLERTRDDRLNPGLLESCHEEAQQ